MLRIAEPMTVLTDALLAVLCAVLAFKLLTAAGSQRTLNCWGHAFFWTALMSLAGALRHGLAPHLDPFGKNLLFKAVLLFSAVATFNLIRGLVAASLSGDRASVVFVFNGLMLFTYLLFLTEMKDYRFAVTYYLASLTLMATLQHGNTCLMLSLGISIAGSALWLARVSPHPQFNHNDLFHVIQLAALWFLYKGGLALKDVSRPFLN